MFDLAECSDCVLWVMLSDLAKTLSEHTDRDDEVNVYWYILYQDVQKEIDRRILNEGV